MYFEQVFNGLRWNISLKENIVNWKIDSALLNHVDTIVEYYVNFIIFLEN